MTGQWLIADAGGIRAAVPLKDVQKIVECSDVTLLPRLPPAVPGVLLLDGRAIPLVDLGAVCGTAARSDRRNALIVTAGFSTLAFLVDEVDGIENSESLGDSIRLIDPRQVLETLE